jgi:hypothetical protein
MFLELWIELLCDLVSDVNVWQVWCWLSMSTSNRDPNNSQVYTVEQGEPESAKKTKNIR